MITPSLHFGRLFRDAVAIARSIYVPLLVLAIPSLLIAVLNALLERAPGLPALAAFMLTVIVASWFSLATTYFVHRHLTERAVSVGEALQSTSSKIVSALLCALISALIILPGFVLLIIPGIYLAIRFGLALYSIPIENRSAIDALARSWELVRGRWWSVFGAMFLFALVVFLPILIISTIASITAGSEESAEIVAQVVSGGLSFLVSPLIGVYYVLLFLRLRAIAEGTPIDRASPS